MFLELVLFLIRSVLSPGLLDGFSQGNVFSNRHWGKWPWRLGDAPRIV